VAHLERQQHPDHGHDLWKDVQDHDLSARSSQCARRLDRLLSLDCTCTFPHQLRRLSPARHSQPGHERPYAKAESHRRDHNQRRDECRHGKGCCDQAITQPPQEPVRPPRTNPDDDPQNHPHGGNDNHQDDRRAHRPEQPTEEVTSQRVGPQGIARSESGIGRLEPLAVDLDDQMVFARIVGCQTWSRNGQEDHHHDQRAPQPERPVDTARPRGPRRSVASRVAPRHPATPLWQ